MTKYLNSGHDIETAAQMKEAIESSRGVRGVTVKVCMSSQCSIQQEFQVGESELCQQPLLLPGRDKNVGSLRHWPWEEYSLDKVRCP